MKKKIFVVISSTALLAITVSVSLLVGQKTAEKTEASSYSTNNVPTTIDLNDTTPVDIANYYTNLNELDSSERKGTNLLKNLKPILKNGQKYFSYGSSATTAVWQSYEIVDRDWDKSPAEDISSYDATTKIITGYTYGKSNTQTGTNPYIHALYVNRNVTNQTQAWGNHNQDQWGINQEHVWAKSCGFDSESPGTGARGDMMHLWAGNGKVNGQYHSNYYYGYVDTNRTYNDASEYASTLSGNRKGYSKTKGGSYTVFEPQDSDKGDIARAIFYMVARYNYLSGSDSDGIDAGNPNLEIVNQLNWAPGSSYTSSTSNKGQMGILQDLLEWNRLDPPDKWEIHRNNILYNNYTKNRNPFIDFPEWAEYIWGKSEDGNYSSTPTGYADPNTDVINGYKGDTPTPEKSLTSISISSQKTSFNVGDTFTFGGTVTAHYSDTTTANVTSSSTFSGYDMSTTGNQTVTVSYTEGENTQTATYQITVNESITPVTDGDATLYSGALTEGDYVIYYDGKAMNNTVTGANRLSYDEVTVINNKISSPSADIKWRIAPSGNYWTIFNSSVGKYAASTGTKNQAGLTETINDKAKWTASGTSTYEFVNLNNSSGGINANLRNNDTYGFACYSTSTGGALSLYKVSSVQPVAPTSISATVNKNFSVGETITKSDITVKDNNNNVISDFSFANNNYQFTYNDAVSGGTLTDKTFTDAITYGELSCSLTVKVQRVNYQEVENIDRSLTSADKDFASVTATAEANADTYTITKNGIQYETTCSYRHNGNDILSFSDYKKDTKYASDGVFRNITKMPTNIISASFTYNGSNSPSIAATVEYSSNQNDWSTTPGLDSYYFRIYFADIFTGYINIKAVNIVTAGQETARNTANYIMFEDTNNQCLTKLDYAISYFNNMSATERSTFMTSDDYVISTARDRFDKWLISQGKSVFISGGDYVITANKNMVNALNSNNYIYLIITLTGVISISMVGFYFLLKKKKPH